MPDVTTHRHPVLAAPGTWCRRPSGHRAAELHMVRTGPAFLAFSFSYGPLAKIRQDADTGRWEIKGRTSASRRGPTRDPPFVSIAANSRFEPTSTDDAARANDLSQHMMSGDTTNWPGQIRMSLDTVRVG